MGKRAKGPGRAHRKGISLIELTEMFPDEDAARAWFEQQRWPNGTRCARCDGHEVAAVASGKPMPWRCRDCRKYFSVRTGTVMERSKITLKKWAFAIYLCTTNLKGVSSLKLHRDLKITQKSAWFMAHRIREALKDGGFLAAGPIEADETFVGGKEANKHASKRRRAGRGKVGKTPVAGVLDRATHHVSAHVVPDVKRATLEPFVLSRIQPGAAIYTDEWWGYTRLPNRTAVQHGVGEYVNGQAHTNGLESFWSMLKRGYHGTFHHMSPKHLDRYVQEFATRQNLRELDTADVMSEVAARMVGERLTYDALTAGGPAYPKR